MQPEQIVANYEFCKRLKEIGFPQDTLFAYQTFIRHKEEREYLTLNDFKNPIITFRVKLNGIGIAAPTADELIKFLPAYIKKHNETYLQVIRREPRYKDRDYLIYYEDESSGKLLTKGMDNECIFVDENNMANLFSKSIIWLAENGHIDFKEASNEK